MSPTTRLSWPTPAAKPMKTPSSWPEPSPGARKSSPSPALFTADPTAVSPATGIPKVCQLPEHPCAHASDPAGRSSVADAVSGETAAVLVEPIQSMGGMKEIPLGCLSQIQKQCQQHGALLIFDEIQTGVARTGSFLYAGLVNIHPEMVTLAKGIASGFPAGRPTGDRGAGQKGQTRRSRKHVWRRPFVVRHHGSHPGGHRQGTAHRKRRLMGDYLKETLSSIDGVEEVRGRGLLLGVKVREPKTAKELQAGLLKQRILAGSSLDPQVLRMMPPLIITRREADLFVEAVKAAI